ncbi:hypothetical protein SteCoe_3490 [Stentor coeruleus]|uniref:Uncharacterized protein n=1 Tax=Stentor coeruleus TaxID=5963 RepID=A0A1R2CWX3_9CILI|nr:hypothetical protein SteCoe_3490 [Stentor coeruleus]
MDSKSKDFICLNSDSIHEEDNKIIAQNKEKSLTSVLSRREEIIKYVEELSNRNSMIIELENEIYQLKYQSLETGKYTEKINFLKQNIKTQENENKKLLSMVRNQEDKHDNSITKLQQIIQTSRIEKDREILELKTKIQSKNDQINTLSNSFANIQSSISKLEKKFNEKISDFQIKESEFAEQKQMFKTLENSIKEENYFLRGENHVLKIFIDKSQEAEEISIEIDENSEDFLIVENNIMDNRMMKNHMQEDEKYKKLSLNIDMEFRDLKKELDQAIETTSNKKANFQGCYFQKNPSDLETVSLASSLKDLCIELSDLQKSNSQTVKLEEHYQSKIEDLEFKYKALMGRNIMMKSELQEIKNMQKKERNERKKIFQKKLREMCKFNYDVKKFN